MMTLEEWIKGVPVPALKELVVGMKVDGAKRAALEAHLLTHVESRAMAEESKRIEEAALSGRRA